MVGRYLFGVVMVADLLATVLFVGVFGFLSRWRGTYLIFGLALLLAGGTTALQWLPAIWFPIELVGDLYVLVRDAARGRRARGVGL